MAEEKKPRKLGSVTRQLDENTARNLETWGLVFETTEGKPQQLGLEVSGVTVLGRKDDDNNIAPHLDLAPYGADNHGVSRLHATVLPTEEGLCIIDLDSTNGTSVNGERLSVGQRVILKAGDTVELGTLRLLILKVDHL